MSMMMMNGAQPPNALDNGVQGVIGQPLDRYEGKLKVSGQATYAYEHKLDAPPAFGFLVTAKIAVGEIEAIDDSTARAVPGVIDVIIDRDVAPVSSAQASDKGPQQSKRKILHFGQPLGIVVAETFEAAREAAAAIRISYAPAADGRFDLEEGTPKAKSPPANSWFKPTQKKGDADRALREAPVSIDVTYTTPSQTHAAMEPHAAIASWDDDGKLTLYGSLQIIDGGKSQLAKALGIKASKIRVLSPYIGGGFGSKLGIGPEAVLAAHAARRIGRPVKVAQTRQQLFEATTRRSDTIQRIELGANRDGTLTAIVHDSLVANNEGESFFEPAGIATSFLYAAENRRVSHKLVTVDLLQCGSMRAPGEAVGLLALECAIDEMAEKLGIDPIEFRRLNEPPLDPQKGHPFSSRELLPCLDEGARRFGWHERRGPGERREGEWLVGLGVAAAARSNLIGTAEARVRLTSAGRAEIETDMTDIGTGSYSILAQIAGEMLGLPIDRIDVRLGDSDFPASAGSGGSWGAASAGSAVHVACQELVDHLAQAMAAGPQGVTLKDGRAISGNRSVALEDLLAGQPLEATGKVRAGKTSMTFTQASYGAHFCEVGVNNVTGEVRVRRMLGVFAAGRILNEKTARSQCIGGMIFGIGAALSEELAVDKRHGAFVNHDLAEYHVPVNADVPQIEVHFLEERDDYANPLRSKGIGELGIAGAGAAVTNAIYNATGIRVRDYPVTLDKLLDQLP